MFQIYNKQLTCLRVRTVLSRNCCSNKTERTCTRNEIHIIDRRNMSLREFVFQKKKNNNNKLSSKTEIGISL